MRGLRWSIVVHSTLFILFAMNGFHVPKGGAQGEQEQGEQGGQKDSLMNVEIIDPPKEHSEVTLMEQVEEDGLLDKAPHAGDDCDNFYGGIGIIQGYVSQNGGTIVTEVYPWYPAHKAGIEAGDYILNTDDIRGEVGTPIRVRTSRAGRYIEYDLIRDKICTTPPKNKENP